MCLLLKILDFLIDRLIANSGIDVEKCREDWMDAMEMTLDQLEAEDRSKNSKESQADDTYKEK